MSSWSRWISRYRWLIAASLAITCMCLGWHARRIVIDPSNATLIIRDSDAYRLYRQIRAEYNSDENIIIGIEVDRKIDKKTIKWLDGLVSDLELLPHVGRVRSILSLKTIRKNIVGSIYTVPLLSINKEAHRLLGDDFSNPGIFPPGTNMLLSPNKRMTAVIVEIVGSDEDREYRHQLISQVREVMEEHKKPDVKFLLTGTSVVQDTVVDKIGHDRDIFIPATIVAVLTGLLVLCVCWRRLLYTVIVMGSSLMSIEGIMTLHGTPINVVTSLLAPIILIVAVSCTVHLTSSAAELSGQHDVTSRIDLVYRNMFVPCFLAALTTMIGFMSLLVSRIPAIQEFGLYGAIGTAIAWILAMGWLPVFLGGGPYSRDVRAHRLLSTLGSRIGSIVTRFRKHIIYVAILFIFAAACSAPMVRVSTNLLHTLKSSDQFRIDTESVQSALGGIYPLDVLVKVPEEKELHSLDNWRMLERFGHIIEGSALVSSMVGPTDVLNYIESASRTKRTIPWLGSILEWFKLDGSKMSHGVASHDLSYLKWTVFLGSSDTSGVVALADQIRSSSKDILPKGWFVDVSGMVLLLAHMSQQLVYDEVASVGITFCLIMLIAWVALRSFKYAMISILPNMIPIAGLFGLMAAWGIPLSSATAVIASVALGLVFDNTIHLIYQYRLIRANNLDAVSAANKALSRCTYPIVTSSLVLVMGFGVTLFGQLLPTVQFGLLTCTIIGLALVGDLIVLPSILIVCKANTPVN